MPDLQNGTVLNNGRYRIDGILGNGGFGITYIAFDINLQRKVAIKEFFLRNYCTRDDASTQVSFSNMDRTGFVSELKQKFFDEAVNIAKLSHPNIITVYDYFRENNTAYYVMEYISEGTLADKLNKEGKIYPDQALQYITEIGDALTYLHDESLCHLDIKPSNIMLKNNKPVLIDFGLSKQYDDNKKDPTTSTPTGISAGFSPIEQYNNKTTPKSDQYSLAATLYNMLSGYIPPTATELVQAKLAFPDSIPQKLVPAINKAMSLKADDRYDSVDSFINALDGKKPKPNPNPDPRPWWQKNLYFIIGGIIAVIFCVFLRVLGCGSAEPAEYLTADTLVYEDPIDLVSPYMENMEWEFPPLGTGSYTGDTEYDDSGKVIPHGTGEVTLSGNVKGTYKGEVKHGQLSGKGTFTDNHGNIFDGTYKDNLLIKGKYTTKDGKYFEGTFKDGQPYNGEWHYGENLPTMYVLGGKITSDMER